jgi:hypothetical protein
MKYLKSFKRINESVFSQFISQRKPYLQVTDTDAEKAQKELSEIRGKLELNEADISRIVGILNRYLREEITGMKIVQSEIKNVNNIESYAHVGQFHIQPRFSVFCYDDDYFVMSLTIPYTYKVEFSENPEEIYLAGRFFAFMMDGWDGFEEWAEKDTPFVRNVEMYNLLTRPTKDFSNVKRKELPWGLISDIRAVYPHVKDGSWRRLANGDRSENIYFFDKGEHFLTVEKINDGRNYYYQDDGSLSQRFPSRL